MRCEGGLPCLGLPCEALVSRPHRVAPFHRPTYELRRRSPSRLARCGDLRRSHARERGGGCRECPDLKCLSVCLKLNGAAAGRGALSALSAVRPILRASGSARSALARASEPHTRVHPHLPLTPETTSPLLFRQAYPPRGRPGQKRPPTHPSTEEPAHRHRPLLASARDSRRHRESSRTRNR